MKAGTLAGAVKDVLGCIEAKTTIPILSHLLFEAGAQEIALTGTDLDMLARRTLASDDRDGPASADWCAALVPFAVALPAQPLAAILKGIDADAMVMIEAVPDSSATVAAQVTISAGRARWRLNSLPSADFPTMPFPEGEECAFSLPASVLADAFHAVDHAISTEEARYYLNGIYLHADGLLLKLAATDGHKLARIALDGPDGAASFPAVIVPRRAVALLGRLLEATAKAGDESGEDGAVDVIATTGGTRLRFTMAAADGGDVEIVTKAIDGSFPDYARVIPAASDRVVRCARAPLIEAIKRMTALAAKDTNAIDIAIEPDLIRLTVTNLGLGEASEELPCQWAHAPTALAMNATYLRQALGKIATDDVALQIDDAGLPVRIEAVGSDEAGPRLIQVVVPIRSK